MAIGVDVVSAYAGPADVDSFKDIGKVSETKTHKIQYSEKELTLYNLYSEVRTMREKNSFNEDRLLSIFSTLQEDYDNDWLLSLEIYELLVANSVTSQQLVLRYLLKLKEKKEFTELIENGLALIKTNEVQS